MSAGRFITFEGGEGSGKSTQVRMLVAALEGQGIGAIATREPGGTPAGERIRELILGGDHPALDPMTEALLHFAARREHLVGTIWPALGRGAWVVCDRFADSTLAYQGQGLGLGDEAVRDLYRLTVGDFRPDCTFVLDLPVACGFARVRGRNGPGDRYEDRDAAFHERLRTAFLAIARAEPARCTVIDARPGADAVHAAVMAALRARPEFGLG